MTERASGFMRLAEMLLLILFCCQFASSHKQPVHQYIAREAYSLLAKTYGKDIPQLSAFIGLADPSFAGDSAWQKGFLTTGAWREDDEDVVYHYDILPGLNYALTSITHFWSADRGDGVENMFTLQIDRPPLPPISTDIGPYPNTFAKLMKFAHGGWVLDYPRPFTCVNAANNHRLIITPLVSTAGFGVPLSYSGLTTFYSDMKLAVRSDQPSICAVFDVTDVKSIQLGDIEEVQVGDDVRNAVVWEVLGRMCHLLGDMSVPAHAHLDEHGLNLDSYEDYVGGTGDPYNVWNADNAGPAILLNGPTDQVLHVLMYTMQQQADHFGSNGPANGNGNDIIGGDASQAERDFLNAINLSSLGGPTTDAGPWSATNLNTIRDKTLPFAIRATAGLLYWFCVTTAIVSPMVSDVSEQNHDQPAAVYLSQNYPNPFNPTTKIEYLIRVQAQVELKVYNIVGQEVATLVNEVQKAGVYSVKFSAMNSACGMYFYRITAGNFTIVEKMVLVK